MTQSKLLDCKYEMYRGDNAMHVVEFVAVHANETIDACHANPHPSYFLSIA